TLAALEELRQVPTAFALAASGGELVERVRRIIGMPAPRTAGPAQGQMRWHFAGALLGAGLVLALRIGRDDARIFTVPELPANWLQLPTSAALPLASLTLPFERPRLRLVAPADVPPASAVAIDAARTATAPAMVSVSSQAPAATTPIAMPAAPSDAPAPRTDAAPAAEP